MLTLGILLAFLLATPLVQQACYGQATTASGAIQGTISDPQGAILPGAQITVTSLATGAKKTLTASSSGFYSVASLVPGEYQVTVTVPGFAKTTTTLTVQIGITANGDMKMKVGAATETVMVSTEVLQVNTVQSTVEGVLTAQQIDNLPISGRNFLDLSQLEPGVQLQSGETFDPTKAGYSSISFNGVNGRTARIMLDGQDISDETVGTTTLNVSQGSIEEFNISRSSLDISNELTSSGAVAVSTRRAPTKSMDRALDSSAMSAPAQQPLLAARTFPSSGTRWAGAWAGRFSRISYFSLAAPSASSRTRSTRFNRFQFSPFKWRLQRALPRQLLRLQGRLQRAQGRPRFWPHRLRR